MHFQGAICDYLIDCITLFIPEEKSFAIPAGNMLYSLTVEVSTPIFGLSMKGSPP